MLELPELTPNYRTVVTRAGRLDEAAVEVQVSDAFLTRVLDRRDLQGASDSTPSDLPAGEERPEASRRAR